MLFSALGQSMTYLLRAQLMAARDQWKSPEGKVLLANIIDIMEVTVEIRFDYIVGPSPRS